ncbi:hypothetical protein ACJ72_07438 [Emergomyces africanus]|uniref:Uncharacterized protein n=1 Tax=Emergomyces africanus TaxID=1955775 RepID=A0A1B7NN85_9EURO|nr:hypothetical protein ACJ72_07438 [Emergomyces africanus]
MTSSFRHITTYNPPPAAYIPQKLQKEYHQQNFHPKNTAAPDEVEPAINDEDEDNNDDDDEESESYDGESSDDEEEEDDDDDEEEEEEEEEEEDNNVNLYDSEHPRHNTHELIEKRNDADGTTLLFSGSNHIITFQEDVTSDEDFIQNLCFNMEKYLFSFNSGFFCEIFSL